MKMRFFGSLGLLILLFSYACGGSSEVDRKQAQAAMDQAKSLHADTLAPKDFQQARESWDRAQAADKEGRTDAAKVLFSSARIHFGEAADIAKSKRDALSRQLDSMQTLIGSNFDQVKIDLSVKNLAPAKKSQVAAIVAEVEKGNALILRLLAEEDYPGAVAAAKNVQTQIYHAQLILAGQKIK